MKGWWNLPWFSLSTVMVFNEGSFFPPGNVGKSGDISGCQKRGNKERENATLPGHRRVSHNKESFSSKYP